MKKCTGCARRRAKMKKVLNNIFVPTKNIYFPNRNWGMKKYQRGILHPAGFWQTLGDTLAFDETITNGFSVYCTDGTSDDFDVFGYLVSTIGSITGTTYTDGGSNSQTVDGIYWEEPGSGSCTGDRLFLRLSGTSIANTDTTFKYILKGVEQADRSAATYTASVGGDTQWRWASTGSSNTSIKIYT